eukprot:gnl/TRDRNA2_/TRDRNA2_150740_c0_seq1.p1 gnl/TRDRNA2_/TRDRNA2_150740_c0~~gnl/TRDRNA2_/TRDRNA2_150740_c0_seq1.p1  ORF type:complete len:262 (-),score=38.68 gnl/TRDRNA2_/TRDRNA2_150740_c0_seq1:108-827(-)
MAKLTDAAGRCCELRLGDALEVPTTNLEAADAIFFEIVLPHVAKPQELAVKCDAVKSEDSDFDIRNGPVISRGNHPANAADAPHLDVIPKLTSEGEAAHSRFAEILDMHCRDGCIILSYGDLESFWSRGTMCPLKDFKFCHQGYGSSWCKRTCFKHPFFMYICERETKTKEASKVECLSLPEVVTTPAPVGSQENLEAGAPEHTPPPPTVHSTPQSALLAGVCGRRAQGSQGGAGCRIL